MSRSESTGRVPLGQLASVVVAPSPSVIFREKNEPFGLSLVLRGAGERLSPILMTTLATALALVPLVAYGDRPGQEIEFPMAVVILGGLLTSTVLNLFVLPALYLWIGGITARPGSGGN